MPRTPYYVPLFVTFKAASPALIDLTLRDKRRYLTNVVTRSA